MHTEFIKSTPARAVVGVVIAAALAIPLYFLLQHREAPAPSTSGSSSAAATPGNPTADKVHELKALEEELEKKPEHPPILLRMAQLSSELGKSADAISYLQRLVKGDPGNVDGRLELSRLLYQTNDVGASLRETQKILDSNPKNVDALYNAGAIYANLNNFSQARTYWNRAVDSDPDSDSGKRAREGLAKLAQSTPASSAAVHP